MPTNVLDWKGPDFLALYIGLLIGGVILGIALRWLLRLPLGDLAQSEPLDAYEMAYLRGGPKRVVDAAVTKLYRLGFFKNDTDPGRLVTVAMIADGLNTIEMAVLANARTSTTVPELRKSVKEAAREPALRLAELGLVPAAKGLAAKLSGALIMAVLFVFAMLKVEAGLSRHRPVAFLVIAGIVALIAAVVFLVVPIYRSRRGDRAIAEAEEANAALEHVAARHADSIGANDLAFAVALFGVGALAGGFGPLHTAMTWKPPTGAASNTGCGFFGSGCGSSSGGSSGCGGGCGGGGCGGCGG